MNTRLPALLCVALLAGCAALTTPRPTPLSTEDIVQMSKNGVPAQALIQRIEASGAVYSLKASELARLREQGVADAVIDRMQQTYIDAERFREAMRERDRMWLYGPPGYWGPWHRPFR